MLRDRTLNVNRDYSLFSGVELDCRKQRQGPTGTKGDDFVAL